MRAKKSTLPLFVLLMCFSFVLSFFSGNGHALASEGRQGLLQLAHEVPGVAGAEGAELQVPLPHAAGKEDKNENDSRL